MTRPYKDPNLDLFGSGIVARPMRPSRQEAHWLKHPATHLNFSQAAHSYFPFRFIPLAFLDKYHRIPLPQSDIHSLPAMPSRTPPAFASAVSLAYEPHTSSSSSTASSFIHDNSPRPARKVWVDPASLSNCGDASRIQGNVSTRVKQLILNTFIAYGAGDEQCFGHHVGKSVKFVDISVYDSKEKQGRMEAVTTAEVVVDKSTWSRMARLGASFKSD